MTAHLGYEEGKDAPLDQSNRRNGTASKRLKGQDGEVPIAVPRDGTAVSSRSLSKRATIISFKRCAVPIPVR
ncbi:transposase [Leisingera sp. HS039]|uniref:transposase n=1 Tax=Leisingera sp. HS039 TaxID=2818496 RepID=UPI0032B3AAEF